MQRHMEDAASGTWNNEDESVVPLGEDSVPYEIDEARQYAVQESLRIYYEQKERRA